MIDFYFIRMFANCNSQTLNCHCTDECSLTEITSSELHKNYYRGRRLFQFQTYKLDFE